MSARRKDTMHILLATSVVGFLFFFCHAAHADKFRVVYKNGTQQIIEADTLIETNETYTFKKGSFHQDLNREIVRSVVSIEKGPIKHSIPDSPPISLPIKELPAKVYKNQDLLQEDWKRTETLKVHLLQKLTGKHAKWQLVEETFYDEGVLFLGYNPFLPQARPVWYAKKGMLYCVNDMAKSVTPEYNYTYIVEPALALDLLEGKVEAGTNCIAFELLGKIAKPACRAERLKMQLLDNFTGGRAEWRLIKEAFYDEGLLLLGYNPLLPRARPLWYAKDGVLYCVNDMAKSITPEYSYFYALKPARAFDLLNEEAEVETNCLAFKLLGKITEPACRFPPYKRKQIAWDMNVAVKMARAIGWDSVKGIHCISVLYGLAQEEYKVIAMESIYRNWGIPPPEEWQGKEYNHFQKCFLHEGMGSDLRR